jgi:phage terminase large subunit
VTTLAQPQQSITEQEAVEIFQFYEEQPKAVFIQDFLGSDLWNLQSEIANAVFTYPLVAVKSCNASGKSYISARIALAFLTLKPGSIVITTAPTWRQVKDVLWREIRTALKMSPYKLTDKQANQVGLDISEDWFAVGLSTKDAEKFFGYHADDILVIVDEASGIEEEVYVGVDAVTPNVNAHVLMIGNPTNPDGRFYKAFNDPLVKKFTISAFDTPNFTANNIHTLDDLINLFTPPIGVDELEHLVVVQKSLKLPYPALINPANVYRRYLQWGDEHPMWEALIMGQFPSQASSSLIPLGLILKSVEVWKQINAAKKDKEMAKKPEWNIKTSETYEYGLDVARFGDDSNVLFPKKGGYIEKAKKWAKVDTSITTDRVIESLSLEDWKAVIRVDDIGVGGAVTDQLKRRKQENPEKYHYTVIPVNFAAGTTKPEKYYNLRTETYDNLAQMFINHEIAIPDDEELIAELATIRVEFTGKDTNIKKIEAKEKIKERLGRSPDKADALALACAKSGRGSWDEIYEDFESVDSDPPKRHERERLDPQPISSGMLDERY